MAAERRRRVVVDTYALLAIVYDELGSRARSVMEDIRLGRTAGLIPATVAYEYTVHWLRGRVPGLKSLEEVSTYLRSYFRVVELGFDDYLEAAVVKEEGDKLLREAEDPELRARRLSIVDSTVISIALKTGAPIITGDKDLTYVARRMKVETIW